MGLSLQSIVNLSSQGMAKIIADSETRAYSFRSQDQSTIPHYKKHGQELGVTSRREYIDIIAAVLDNPKTRVFITQAPSGEPTIVFEASYKAQCFGKFKNDDYQDKVVIYFGSNGGTAYRPLKEYDRFHHLYEAHETKTAIFKGGLAAARDLMYATKYKIPCGLPTDPIRKTRAGRQRNFMNISGLLVDSLATPTVPTHSRNCRPRPSSQLKP
jgi:hypothetical protein